MSFNHQEFFAQHPDAPTQLLNPKWNTITPKDYFNTLGIPFEKIGRPSDNVTVKIMRPEARDYVHSLYSRETDQDDAIADGLLHEMWGIAEKDIEQDGPDMVDPEQPAATIPREDNDFSITINPIKPDYTIAEFWGLPSDMGLRKQFYDADLNKNFRRYVMLHEWRHAITSDRDFPSISTAEADADYYAIQTLRKLGYTPDIEKAILALRSYNFSYGQKPIDLFFSLTTKDFEPDEHEMALMLSSMMDNNERAITPDENRAACQALQNYLSQLPDQLPANENTVFGESHIERTRRIEWTYQKLRTSHTQAFSDIFAFAQSPDAQKSPFGNFKSTKTVNSDIVTALAQERAKLLLQGYETLFAP